jgi:plasmid stabilization system protein ParE
MNRRFHPEFENDLISAARFYQKQRSGLGAEFLDAAEQAVAPVMQAPQRWPIRVAGVRRYLLSRFPYILRYRIDAATETVDFLSIIHTSRHPDTAKER